MPIPRFMSIKSANYGNANKVVSNMPTSWLASERRIFRRTFHKNTVNANLEKDWSKDKTSSGVTDKLSAVEVGIGLHPTK